jgi:hypothetical protein
MEMFLVSEKGVRSQESEFRIQKKNPNALADFIEGAVLLYSVSCILLSSLQAAAFSAP